jgi:hypothetical protein
MAKRQTKQSAKATKPPDLTAGLQKALTKIHKAELVAVLMELAAEDRAILRRLTAQFDVAVPLQALVAATRRAIADATDFDAREINYNFSYDHAAYDEVKRNLGRLVAQGQLRPAMKLSLELMGRGSYQVEMSDEGLMTDEIEGCLTVVIRSLKACDLPPTEVIAWCSAMLKEDRVGFLCDQELRALRDHYPAS